MKAFIDRVRMDDKRPTLGQMTIWDALTCLFACYTLELPWKENKRQISCIPTGNYKVVYAAPTANFPYPHFRVLNVPDRDGILIHRGCFKKNTLGCILVGMRWKDINNDGETDVEESKAALNRLWELLGEKPFDLTISA